MSASTSAAPVTDTPAPTSILKKSKSSSSATTAPSSAQQAEAAALEASLPAAPKKERKPKRARPEEEPKNPASAKRVKQKEVPDLPQVEGKKAEKRRLRAEAQAARPKLPTPEAEATKKPAVWDVAKNGQNPYEDESLSDAAKKAIAYSTTIQGEFFKFTKARQNYLLRHVYSAEEIPERYLSLVLAYLQTVKGGSRSALISQATSILNPPSTPTPAPTTDAEPSTEDAPAPTPAPAAAAAEDEDSPEEKASKQARAKKLLIALGELGEDGEKVKKSKKSKKSKGEKVEGEAEVAEEKADEE